MVYAYIRFSTDHQDETQQMHVISEYASQRGLAIDVFEKDEGVSGGVSYRNRKLYKVVEKMKSGDMLVVSEISRLGRCMSDLNRLVNDELKPRKIRLIVIKMGLDLDCANLKAVDEMILFAFSFAAQIEKEMIQQRTQAALDAIRDEIRKNGGHMSKNNRWIKHLGREKGCDTSVAVATSARNSIKLANEWRSSSALYLWVENQLLKRRPRKEIVEEAQALFAKNPGVYCTRTGKPLTQPLLSIWEKEIKMKI